MTRLACLAAFALLSCSPDEAPPQITVGDVWARETLPGQPTGAAYLTIANAGGADTLIAVSSPAAASATLHTTAVSEGVARMRALDDGLAIPAGETVKLAPGATHVMLTGLRAPLRRGESLELRLSFRRSGEILVTGTVREAGAAAPHGGH